MLRRRELMPIYQYKCLGCGYSMEARHSITEPNLSHCPICRLPALIKDLSSMKIGLRYGAPSRMDGYTSSGKKIDGFYNTEYKHNDWIDQRTDKG